MVRIHPGPPKQKMTERRGFCAIGIYHPKHEVNVGTLWRSAFAFGAAFIFTVGRRYTRQASDTEQVVNRIPLFHYKNIEDLIHHLPHSCPLIGVELHDSAKALNHFRHPTRAAYLLGAEDGGIPSLILEQCHYLLQIPFSKRCLNVAVAGSIVLYDRAHAFHREETKPQM